MADDAALDALYQEVILDHYRRPRNFRVMDGATCTADGKNPNCGDALTVWLRLDGDRVAEASFQGVGCAISRASASLMTQAITGKSRAEADALLERLRRETQRIGHPTATQTALVDSSEGWRVTWWPFTHPRQAENARAAMASRRFALEVVAF